MITDGRRAAGPRAWLMNVSDWLLRGVDVVQIRESALNARELAQVTREVLNLPNPHGAKILVNDRADVAIACGAHGVHLRDGSVPTGMFAGSGLAISVACHKPGDVIHARGASFILLAPVFTPLSKQDTREPLGLESLRAAAVLTDIPVLALGGVTEANANSCIAAGAAGIAGIGLFRPVQ